MDGSPIGHFAKFCFDVNINLKNIDPSLKKYLLAYQRNILQKQAFDTLFNNPNEFMNWDYVDRSLPRLDAVHWINMFKHIQFDKVPRTKSELAIIQGHLKSIGVEADIACEIFLLKNTNFITSQFSIERLFSEFGIPEAYTKSMQFLAKNADSAFDIQETTNLFCHIMNTALINASDLERQLQFLLIKENELSTNFKVKQLRATGRRPKLRSKLMEMQKDSRSVFDTDTFLSWCQSIRFPSVFSLHTKHKLYFLMSQTAHHVEKPHAHVHTITRDTFVLNALSKANVQKPEFDVLYKVITSMHLIEGPFQELLDFKNESMGAFPSGQLSNIKLNDLLHLYVCAYQSPFAWKDVWKQLIPLLSHQVIRDVEAFTNRRKFNFEAVLRIMNEDV